MSNIELPTHLINNIKQHKEYSTLLTNVDIDVNMNKYFNIILYKHKVINTYFLLSSYGRLGRVNSDTKVKCIVNNEESAINDFKSLFYEKTGINWENRSNAEHISGKYNWVNQYDEEDDTEYSNKIIENWLVDFIMDIVKECKDYRKNKNLDIPISKSNINNAYNILNEIKELLSKNSVNYDLIKSLSNKFYSLIPSTDKVIKILDNNVIIKDKLEILEFYELNGNINISNSSIPKQISLFRYTISLVNFTSDIGKLIINYYNNGIGSYAKKIINIYSLTEKNDFNFTSKNVYLFWHGTKHQYVQSILTNSLILPNSNIRHLMFGPGIYFANASCKSTAYSDKYMLLCEVDLGNTLVMYNSNNSLIVSKPYDSVTAYGKQSFKNYINTKINDSNAYVPNGKLITATYKTCTLNFDEFIIYDINRVKIKYILEWK